MTKPSQTFFYKGLKIQARRYKLLPLYYATVTEPTGYQRGRVEADNCDFETPAEAIEQAKHDIDKGHFDL